MHVVLVDDNRSNLAVFGRILRDFAELEEIGRAHV